MAPSAGSGHLNIDGILSRSAYVYRSRFGAVSRLAFFSVLITAFLHGANVVSDADSTISLAWILVFPVWILGNILVAGAITRVVGDFEQARETESRTSRSLEILGSIFAILPSISALVLVCFLLTALGLVLVVLPGVTAAILLAVAFPVMIIEGRGILSALRRSVGLTRQYALRISGSAVLIAVLEVFVLSLTLSLTLFMSDAIFLPIVMLSGVAFPFVATLRPILYFRLSGELPNEETLDSGSEIL